jgi:hypothetical protein
MHYKSSPLLAPGYTRRITFDQTPGIWIRAAALELFSVLRMIRIPQSPLHAFILCRFYLNRPLRRPQYAVRMEASSRASGRSRRQVSLSPPTGGRFESLLPAG